MELKIQLLPQRNSQSMDRVCICNQRHLEKALWAAGAQRWLGGDQGRSPHLAYIVTGKFPLVYQVTAKHRKGNQRSQHKAPLQHLAHVVWEKEGKLWSQALLLTSCGTLDNLLLLSGP